VIPACRDCSQTDELRRFVAFKSGGYSGVMAAVPGYGVDTSNGSIGTRYDPASHQRSPPIAHNRRLGQWHSQQNRSVSTELSLRCRPSSVHTSGLGIRRTSSAALSTCASGGGGCQLAVRHHHHHHRGRAIYSMATLPEMPVGPSYQLQPERGRAARLIKIYDEKILWGWS
jgi:hypothetical protein